MKGGVGSLIYGGCLFMVGGIIAVVFQPRMYSVGALQVRKTRIPNQTFAYEGYESLGFGIFFVLIATVLFYMAWRIQKSR